MPNTTLGRPLHIQNLVRNSYPAESADDKEAVDNLEVCHNGLTGGHHGANLTAIKFAKSCRGGIDFIGPFPVSPRGNKLYPRGPVDYLSKWVEAKALNPHQPRPALFAIHKIPLFARLEQPRAIIVIADCPDLKPLVLEVLTVRSLEASHPPASILGIQYPNLDRLRLFFKHT
ncbi:hypothetical protein Tco_1183560 [Tanacetum coccineum]